MNGTPRCACAFLFLALCCGAAYTQITSSGKQAPPQQSTKSEKKSSKDVPPSHPWVERARLITAEIEHDSGQLGPYDAALVNARLAQMWWKRDETARARQWLDLASAAVTRIPANESAKERQQRLDAGYEIVTIATPLDRAEAKRIRDELGKGAINGGYAAYRANAAIERAAFEQALRGDPNVAARLMSEDLGDGGHLSSQNLGLLRSKSPELADRIFREALEAATANNYDPQTVSSLAEDAYPEHPSADVKGPPEELRQALLRLLAQAALRVPQNEDDRQTVCTNAAQAVKWLGRFPQQQAAAIQSIFDGCNSNPGGGTNVPPGGAKAEVDCHQVGARECLRLADAEPDANRRSNLRLNALFAADETEHDPELAITIYRSLSKEEREKAPGLELMMLNPYANLGEKYLKDKDANSFYNMLNDVDGTLRLRLQMIFAGEFMDQGKTPDAVTLLADARATLERTGSSDTGVYLQLANMYARYLPTDAPYALREAVGGLNRIEAETPNRPERHRAPTPADRLMRPIRMSPAFLDFDSSALSETLNSLESVRMRESLRLGLLQAALLRDQQEREGPKAPGQRPRK